MIAGFLVQARALIPHLHLDALTLAPGADVQGLLGTAGHGVEGIGSQVDQHLFQPVGVAPGQQLFLGQVDAGHHAGPLQALFQQEQGVLHRPPDGHGLGLAGGFAGEGL